MTAKRKPTLPDVQFVVMRIADLRPATYNPRTISDDAMAGLEASITRFGLVQCPVWNKRSGTLIGGHQRVKVLEKAGVIETMVAVVDEDETGEKALNLSLNNQAIAGEFNEALQSLLTEIKAMDDQLFADLQLDELLEPVKESKATDTDEPDDGPTVSKLGELYQLGPHRLLCGDSTQADQVEILLGTDAPAGMIMDPPFDLSYDAWQIPDSVRLLMVWARGFEGLRWLGPMAGDPPLWGVSTLAFSGQVRGWARPEWPCLVHELVYVLRRGEGRGGRMRGAPAASYGLRLTEDGRPFSFYEGLASRSNSMSWQKNPACFAVWCCFLEAGELVYDPCAGSGSSLLACSTAGNPWRGVENQPKWADLIRRRWKIWATEHSQDVGDGID